MGLEATDWLPPGWKIDVKTRRCGRKDKYYVNPSNGLKFNSKLEVLRYLKDSEEFPKPKEPAKIDIEKTVAGNLPPGWIKEVKISKKGGRTRRDPYYIDPVSGRHFRSIPEVFRHLELNDTVKSETKEECSSDLNAESEDLSKSVKTAEASGLSNSDMKADKRVTRLASKKSESELARVSKHAAANKVDMQAVNDNKLEKIEVENCSVINLADDLQSANKPRPHADKELTGKRGDHSGDAEQTRKSGNQDFVHVKQRDGEDSVDGLLSGEQQQVNGVKPLVNQSNMLTENKPTEVGSNQYLQSGSPETTGSEPQPEEANSVGGELHENATRMNKRKKSNSKWTSDLPRRTSKRLARAAVDDSSGLQTRDKTGTEAALTIETKVSIAKTIANHASHEDPAKQKTENLGNSSEPAISKTENPTNNKQTESPLPNLGDNPQPEELKENDDQEKNLDPSLENILMDPCIEFAIKTLTGAIPIEDANKIIDSPTSSLASAKETSASASASVLASGDIWADPCFEFAVKTLTGEMPVDHRHSSQISFQEPLSSSGSGGCIQQAAVDNFYPWNCTFSQLDAPSNPHPRQERLRDHSLPHVINGMSPKFMDTSFQHGLERRRKNGS